MKMNKDIEQYIKNKGGKSKSIKYRLLPKGLLKCLPIEN